jgi:hypothetical protein
MSGSFPTATRLRRGFGGQARVREDAPRSPGEGAGGGAENLRGRAGGSRRSSHSEHSRPPSAWRLLVGGWFPVGGFVGFSPPDFRVSAAFHRRRRETADMQETLENKGPERCSGPSNW